MAKFPRQHLPLIVSQEAHAALSLYATQNDLDVNTAAVQLLGYALLRSPRLDDLPIVFSIPADRPTKAETPKQKGLIGDLLGVALQTGIQEGVRQIERATRPKPRPSNAPAVRRASKVASKAKRPAPPAKKKTAR